MVEKDICIFFRESKSEGFSIFSKTLERYNVFEFDASGNLKVLSEGEWAKVSYVGDINFDKEKIRRYENAQKTFASLIANGWIRIGNENTTSVVTNQAFYRDTKVSDPKVVPLAERINKINSIIQSEEQNWFVNDLLKALEYVRKLQSTPM